MCSPCLREVWTQKSFFLRGPLSFLFKVFHWLDTGCLFYSKSTDLNINHTYKEYVCSNIRTGIWAPQSRQGDAWDWPSQMVKLRLREALNVAGRTWAESGLTPEFVPLSRTVLFSVCEVEALGLLERGCCVHQPTFLSWEACNHLSGKKMGFLQISQYSISRRLFSGTWHCGKQTFLERHRRLSSGSDSSIQFNPSCIIEPWPCASLLWAMVVLFEKNGWKYMAPVLWIW